MSAPTGVTDSLSSLTRMAAIPLTVQNPNSPVWLPTPQDAVLMCEKNGHGPSTFIIRSPDGSEAAFVKYGPLLDMGEARTQNYIANQVNSDEDIVVLVPRVYYAFRYERTGYIIMEYVDGNDCNQNDLDAIALGVNRLRSIPSPTTSPGPVGGGPVTHRFFAGHRSSVWYSSVEDLQEHVNNVSGAFLLFRIRLFTRVKLDSGQVLVLSTSMRKTVETSGSALTIFIRGIFGKIRVVDSSPWILGKPASSLSLFRILLSWMVTFLPTK